MKPENLIATKTARKGYLVKIIDFGIAERLKTGLCSLNGTSGYMAPEQIQYEPISGKSDMFALGCIT